MENYYTVKQTAKILRISVVKVYEFIKSGKLKAYKLGGNGNSKRHWRIAEKDLEQFIKGVHSAGSVSGRTQNNKADNSAPTGRACYAILELQAEAKKRLGD